MLSKPIAFVLLVVATVVAAGGGAYLATIHHQRGAAALLEPSASPLTSKPAAAGDGERAVGATGKTASELEPRPDATAVPDLSPAPPPPPDRQPAPSSVPAPPGDLRKARQRAADAPAGARAASSRGVASRPGASSRPPGATVEVERADGQGAVAAGSPARENGSDQVGAARPWPGNAPSAATAIPAPTELSTRDASGRGNGQGWQEIVVPSESVLGLQLETSLTSEQAHVEDRVDARVSREVRVDGRVAVPIGSRAIGSVMLVERGGRMKERARLGIRFNTLLLPDGTRLPIQTETIYREGQSPASKSSAKIGGAAIGGAVIGAILGGGKGAAIGSGIGAAGGTAAVMASDRQPAVLVSGTPLSVRTLAPVTVTIER